MLFTVVVTVNHITVADIVTDAISSLVLVNVLGLFRFFFNSLFSSVFASLRTLDPCHTFLTILSCRDFAFGRWFPSRACSCCRGLSRFGKGWLAEDTVTACLTKRSTAFIRLWFLALRLRCRHVTTSRTWTKHYRLGFRLGNRCGRFGDFERLHRGFDRT